MKRIGHLLIAIMLLLSLLPISTTSYVEASTSASSIAAPASKTTYTAQATSKASLKKQLVTGLKNYNSTIKITYNASSATVMAQTKQLFNELKTEEQYLAGTLYSTSWSFSNNVLLIKVSYLTTKTREAYVTEQVKKITKSIITSKMTDFEKVKAINEYVANKTTYSTTTKTSPHAAYAILKEGKGVCQAYALLTYRLLKEAGLSAMYVTGKTTESHAWNLVKVDGKWYNLDVTYNDSDLTYNNKFYNVIHYNYFLLSDKVMAKTHTRDAMSKTLPKASSTRFDLFAKTSTDKVNVGITPEKLQMHGNYMYWLEGSNIFEMKIYRANVKSTTLTKSRYTMLTASKILIVNGALYVAEGNNGGLKRVDLATKMTKIIHPTYISDMTIKNGYFYAYYDGKVVYKEKIK